MCCRCGLYRQKTGSIIVFVNYAVFSLSTAADELGDFCGLATIHREMLEDASSLLPDAVHIRIAFSALYFFIDFVILFSCSPAIQEKLHVRHQRRYTLKPSSIPWTLDHFIGSIGIETANVSFSSSRFGPNAIYSHFSPRSLRGPRAVLQ